jgi:hypothetical protein
VVILNSLSFQWTKRKQHVLFHVVCVILWQKNISVNKFCAILHALFVGGSNLLSKKLQFTFIHSLVVVICCRRSYSLHLYS